MYLMKSPLSQFDIINLLPCFISKYDFSITNLSLTILIVVIISIILFYILFKGFVIPRVLQFCLEKTFIFIYRIIKEQIGIEGIIYLPFIFTLFVFILLLNLFSMLPFAFSATSHLIWTLYFSLSICLGIFFLGIFKHQIHFFRLFIPEVPILLYPLMIIIEILSYIIRSFSLAIRLSANIIAGHTLVHILADFVIIMCNLKKILVILPLFLLLSIFILEIGVACLQAYIFIVLICMYLNDSIHLGGH